MIGQYFHVSLKDRFLSSDEKLEISLGTHRLRFLKAPMVHWPEVTFTYEETEKVLFSADAFGTFGVLNGSVLPTMWIMKRNISQASGNIMPISWLVTVCRYRWP